MGCSCQPSPAFTTCARRAQPATWWQAPDEGWRTTRASMPMASTVSTVSRSDSPFLTDDVAAENDRTSAESRLAAVSKESRVRVDSSKNRVATTLAPQGGHLGDGPALDLGEGLGHPQDLGDAVRAEVGHRQEVCHRCSRVPMVTPSSPTSTISSRRVGRFLPT